MDKRQRLMLLGVAAAVAVVVVIIAIASSGGDDDKKDSTSSTAATAPAPDATITDKTAQEPAPPEPEQISIKGGEPDGGVEKISVKKNEPLEIEVTSDEKLPIHFHGYDIEKPAAPGKPAVFKFEAKNEGVYEMEIESTGTKIAEITVKP